MKSIASLVLGIVIAAVTIKPLDAAVTQYFDRSVFELQNPGLVVEDFENAITPVPGLGIPSPVNSSTDNAVFSPGDIIAGVEFSNPGFDGLLSVLTAGIGSGQIPELESKTLFTSSEASFLPGAIDIAFPLGTFAVGFDVYGTLQFDHVYERNVTISIFSGSALLDQQTITTSFNGPVFLGVSSTSETITRVNVLAENRFEVFTFEGIDNVAFLPIPEPASGCLAVLQLAFLIAAPRYRQYRHVYGAR